MGGQSATGEEWVELKMQDVGQIFTDSRYSDPDGSRPDYFLNTGSPHFVRFVPSLPGLDVKKQGSAIRYAEKYRADGINVNFVEAAPNNGLCIRTYERGVEDETLACGTGVTAAALAYAFQQGVESGNHETPVKALGGDLLVRFTAHPQGRFSNIWLCGPAKQVFEGNISLF